MLLRVPRNSICEIAGWRSQIQGFDFNFDFVIVIKVLILFDWLKDPEPVEPWSGVREAKEYGDVSAQFDWRTKQIIGSDDCLYLNVYTKELTPTVPRPVMVWIHGGGFVGGSGNDDVYGPDFLVEKDVVLVTINYRLGILGNFIVSLKFVLEI